MKNKTLVCTLLALFLTSAGLSFAQGRSPEHRNDGKRIEQTQRHNPHDWRNPQATPYNQERAQNYARHDGRGAGPDHQFYRGERMPPQYRSHQYVVNDWRGHRLSAPPRGYHWIQTGGDYVLISISSGIILQLFIGN